MRRIQVLQFYTDDKFRGRVFSADLGLLMLTVALSSYLAGIAVDWGIPARRCAMFTGFSMLLPACVWAHALRSWGKLTAKLRA